MESYVSQKYKMADLLQNGGNLVKTLTTEKIQMEDYIKKTPTCTVRKNLAFH
jgi:hypothetical protein